VCCCSSEHPSLCHGTFLTARRSTAGPLRKPGLAVGRRQLGITCLVESGALGSSANADLAPSTLLAAACRPRPGCSSFSCCSMAGVMNAAAASRAPRASARTCGNEGGVAGVGEKKQEVTPSQV
jgi:hypothetical protein